MESNLRKKIIYVEGINKWSQVISAVIASVMATCTLFIMGYDDSLICEFNRLLPTEQTSRSPDTIWPAYS